MDKKDFNEDIPSFLHRMMQPDPADDTEEKQRELQNYLDATDIETFLRRGIRRSACESDDKALPADATIPDSGEEIPRFLRTADELRNVHFTPKEMEERRAELKAIEEEAYNHGKDGICRQCFKPARLYKIGACVWARPCGHRQGQGEPW